MKVGLMSLSTRVLLLPHAMAPEAGGAGSPVRRNAGVALPCAGVGYLGPEESVSRFCFWHKSRNFFIWRQARMG